MKLGKIVLALVLAGGAVAAYWYFPDPLGDQVTAAQKAAADKAAEKPAPEPAGVPGAAN